MAERAAPAVRAARRRALRVHARPVRRPPRRGRGGRAALARVEPAAHRPRRVERLRHPDVRDPARAGPPRRARAADRGCSPAARGRAARGGPGSGRPARRAGDGGRGPPRARARAPRGLRRAARLAVARVADVPGRRLRGASATPTLAALVYPELAPLRGRQRRDRPRRRLLRRGRPLPRHARRDARRATTAPPSTSSTRSRSTARWARARGSRTRSTPTAGRCACAAAPRRRRARLGDAHRGGDARRADRHADAARTRPRRSARASSGARTPPDDLSWREVDILRLVALGRSNREIGQELSSAATPSPTTCAASCARRARRTAPRQPATPIATPWWTSEPAAR